MEKIVILGCGGHAKAIVDIVESTRQWKIEGLIGLEEEINKSILGYKVIGCDKDRSLSAKELKMQQSG